MFLFQYVVVQFVEEKGEKGDVSVIPTSWLKENETKCLWPTNSKNIRTLIIRQQQPQDNWAEYSCITHEKFRKYEVYQTECQQLSD